MPVPRRLARPLAAAALALALAGCGASVLPTITSDADRLAAARTLMARRNWIAAAELLRVHVDRSLGSADVDEAIYLLGECHLGAREWALAQVEFERLVRDYPESDSAAAASFQLGAALFGQTRPADFDQEFTVRAIEQWQRYLASYPGHWRNAEAERRIADGRARLARKLDATGRLYVKLRRPGPARVYFERVRDEYADTPLVGDALIGLAWCDALEGRRAQALERLDDLEARFRGQPLAARAAAERARIARVRPVEADAKDTRVRDPQTP
uniref:Outer membrane protein assembly factor BamD n=1 Tax=Eiseniibacteriota bacterium TaxID=2212470 RepID=A0A832HZ28_UNCEI